MSRHLEGIAIAQILAQHFDPGCDIRVRLTGAGQLSGLMYSYYPSGKGLVNVCLPLDWRTRVHDAGISRIKYADGLLTLSAQEIAPPDGAERAWIALVVRTDPRRVGVQFGQVGTVVRFGDRLWYHGDGVDKAMEAAAEETARGLGLEAPARLVQQRG
jgi:hypothetical protein